MKITFTFSDTPNLDELSKDNIYNTYLELPDEAKNLPDYEQRILEIASMVAKLTHAALHITCKEANLRNHPAKITSEPLILSHDGLRFNTYTLIILFERRGGRRTEWRQLKVLLPIQFPIEKLNIKRHPKRSPDRKNLKKRLIQLSWLKPPDEQGRALTQTMQTLTEQILALLNTEPLRGTREAWKYKGFHPRWGDQGLIERTNKYYKKGQR